MESYSSVNDIKTEVEALFRNVTGRYPLTAVEYDIVAGAIVDALQVVTLEYGMEDFRFRQDEIELSVTAGTNYVNLPEYAFKIVPGSMRIASKSVILSPIEEEHVFTADPDLSATGIPSGYYFMAQDDINIIKVGLWPNPSESLTINAKVHMYPAETISSLPASLNMAIKLKAKALACLGLGIINAKQAFENEYESIIEKIKDSYDPGVPKHVGVSLSTNRGPRFTERGMA